ncbi:ECF sigma factor [Planctomycetes bacterium Poly30]|uniref:ECF sigma factor n=1 Tax=Saltatorellus ferox TaxID=2528018 RepID=A0A518ET65_9BACT|nr:ECF sigma factor [Planctomycetes bacterium Poly30]
MAGSTTDASSTGDSTSPTEADGLEKLFAALYQDLYRSAARAMAKQGPGHTLQPTALVSEAYLKLMGGATVPYSDCDHFLLAASKAMRHVLVDHFRARTASTRPQGRVDIDLELLMGPYAERAVSLERIDEALTELGRRDADAAKLVELRFFGGVGMEEIARILDTPVRTLERRWSGIKRWLHERLS